MRCEKCGTTSGYFLTAGTNWCWDCTMHEVDESTRNAFCEDYCSKCKEFDSRIYRKNGMCVACDNGKKSECKRCGIWKYFLNMDEICSMCQYETDSDWQRRVAEREKQEAKEVWRLPPRLRNDEDWDIPDPDHYFH